MRPDISIKEHVRLKILSLLNLSYKITYVIQNICDASQTPLNYAQKDQILNFEPRYLKKRKSYPQKSLILISESGNKNTYKNKISSNF